MPGKDSRTGTGDASGMRIAATQRMANRTKSRIERLALFGAPPAFEEKLHVGRPNIGDRWRLMQRMAEVLDSRWLTNDGPQVKEFEHQIEQMLGVRHCIAMCNATIALEIAVRAAG